jgi:NTE family protein
MQAVRRLVAKLPPALRDDVDARTLAALPAEAAVTVVHLIYRSKHYESHTKDYEFSRRSMLEHWEAGRADTTRTLHDPRWLGRKRNATGIHVYDLAAPTPTDKTASVGDSGLREHHNRGQPPPTPKLERT